MRETCSGSGKSVLAYRRSIPTSDAMLAICPSCNEEVQAYRVEGEVRMVLAWHPADLATERRAPTVAGERDRIVQKGLEIVQQLMLTDDPAHWQAAHNAARMVQSLREVQLNPSLDDLGAVVGAILNDAHEAGFWVSPN